MNLGNKKLIKIPNLHNSESGAGFTLVELLTVAAVIIIMSSIAYIGFTQSQAKNRDKKRIADFRLIQNALERYRQDHGTYPSKQICPALWEGTYAISGETEHSTVDGLLSEPIWNCVKRSDGTLGPVSFVCGEDGYDICDEYSSPQSCWGCYDLMHETGWDCLKITRTCDFMSYLEPYTNSEVPNDPVNELGYFDVIPWSTNQFHQYNEATYRYNYTTYLNYNLREQNVCWSEANGYTIPLCERYIKKCFVNGIDTGILCFDSPCSNGTCTKVSCTDDLNCRGNCAWGETCTIKEDEYNWETCPGYGYYVLSTHMETEQSGDSSTRCCSCPSRPLSPDMTDSIILQQPLDNIGCIDNPNGYAVCGFIPITGIGGQEANPYQP